MSFINYASREINCKVVYYGPGLCGKTTNLQWIYSKTNPESLDNLRVNLQEQGYELDKIPYVVQYNKRDLPNAAPLAEMQRLLNPGKVIEFEACATSGKGVFE